MHVMKYELKKKKGKKKDNCKCGNGELCPGDKPIQYRTSDIIRRDASPLPVLMLTHSLHLYYIVNYSL